MRLLLVTDAWHPQVNGVVRTLSQTVRELEKLEHVVRLVTPNEFPTIACPTYEEIRLAYNISDRLNRLANDFAPDAVHIATEGPLGMSARWLCRRRGWPFTTAYHTRFPEYLQSKLGLPAELTYQAVRAFHRRSSAVMVSTPSMQAELEKRGFARIRQWTRGVDVRLFCPGDKSFLDLPRPILLNVGRVSIEKNLEDFLNLDLPGSKIVIGDGPQRDELRQRFPQAHFPGAKHGEELSRYYQAADVFVFPSRTDTFGLVMLEALACGVPVAAYPVTGPRDVIGAHPVGCMDGDLSRAVMGALAVSPDACRSFALTKSWRESARQFQSNLCPFTSRSEIA